MKRSIVIIFVVLTLICFGWFFQNKMLESVYKDAFTALNDISHLISSKQYSAAKSLFADYLSKWKKTESRLALLVSHEEIDDITRHNARLSACLNEKEGIEGLATIGELHEIYKELNEKFKVNFKTVL